MVKIVFICHSEELVKKLYDTYKNPLILFVGSNSLDQTFYKDVIIVRDLPNNIEYEKSLLTFTAWYAIIKNDLFKDDEHLCLLEYDVKLSENFKETLSSLLYTDKHLDVISFIKGYEVSYKTDIKTNILYKFIESKGEKLYNITDWYSTTNHCIKRTILKDFVDWYYPDYLQIKNAHYKKLAFYHERLFYYYIQLKNLKNVYMEGLEHLQSNSHGYSGLILEELADCYNSTIKDNEC
jgi:hypothetical protein